MNQHGWPEPSAGNRPAEDPRAELARLHEELAQLANGHASAAELWRVVEEIRDVRARLQPVSGTAGRR